MEFEGRITRVLPAREGTSQRGNSWKALPFIFAYFESDDQRWEDRVLLETFDTTIMAQIGQFCEKDASGKVVIDELGRVWFLAWCEGRDSTRWFRNGHHQ